MDSWRPLWCVYVFVLLTVLNWAFYRKGSVVATEVLEVGVILKTPKSPSLALVYSATFDWFDLVFLSLFSLFRVMSPARRGFDIHIHLFWLQSQKPVPLPDYPELEVLRSMTDIPITMHWDFNYSWFSLWKASETDMYWVAKASVRLFMHRLLPDDYLFYCDVDTIWGRDFRPDLKSLLAEHPGRLIYICWDCSMYTPRPSTWMIPYILEKGHKKECFVNNGVYIQPNNKDDIEWRLRQAVAKFNTKGKMMWPDQDVMNYMYSCEEKELIPIEWNNQGICLEVKIGHKPRLEEAIVHHSHDNLFPEIRDGWVELLKSKNVPVTLKDHH
jgi:hypothetical protein